MNPLVSPRLRVLHFTTGDEIIPPDRQPKPGQIRDSNSFLIRGLLQRFQCDVTQRHLPENFELAKQEIPAFRFPLSAFDLLLVSGGASVGEKDFTRPLLEWLGFEIIFSQVNVRPGRPLIFGVSGGQVPASRVAFGLPGNPLSHFVCFHLFVAAALKKLVGEDSREISARPDGREIGRRAKSARDSVAGATGFGWFASAGVGKFRQCDLSGRNQRADPCADKSRFD